MRHLIVMGAAAGAVGLAMAAAPAVEDMFPPAAVKDVRLAGRAGESADACIRARAYSSWARGDMYEE